MDDRPQPEHRVGEPPDAAALHSVLVEAFATYRHWVPEGWSPGMDLADRDGWRIAERLGEPGYWCLIAESGGEAVGYVVLRPAVTQEEPPEPIPGLAHVWHIFVRPAWWGSGVAARLLRCALREAERQGYRSARLWTPRDNARARAFYRREGFRETGAERYAEDLDLDLVQYRRPLGETMLAP